MSQLEMLQSDHLEAPILRRLVKELSYKDDVLVVGAYKGATCNFIRLYNPNVKLTAVEPQTWAYEHLGPGYLTFNVALGIEDNAHATLHEFGTDAASLFPIAGSRSSGSAKLVDAVKFLRHHRLTNLALVVMNIEGYEYPLITYLLRYYPEIIIRKMLIQFHHTSTTQQEAYNTIHKLRIDMHYAVDTVGAGWELWYHA